MSKLAFATIHNTNTTEAVMRKFVSALLALFVVVPIVFAFSFALAQPARAATPSDLAGDWATPGLGAVVQSGGWPHVLRLNSTRR